MPRLSSQILKLFEECPACMESAIGELVKRAEIIEGLIETLRIVPDVQVSGADVVDRINEFFVTYDNLTAPEMPVHEAVTTLRQYLRDTDEPTIKRALAALEKAHE